MQTLSQWKQNNINPYPHKYFVSTSLEEYIEKYGSLQDAEVLNDVTVSVAGT